MGVLDVAKYAERAGVTLGKLGLMEEDTAALQGFGAKVGGCAAISFLGALASDAGHGATSSADAAESVEIAGGVS